jgi:tRNA (guanine9-N1)-methyltransferase
MENTADSTEERPTKLRKLIHSDTSTGGLTEEKNAKEVTVVEQNEGSHENSPSPQASNSHGEIQQPSGKNPLSKNQLKKIRRKQVWDAGREDRALKRKEKRKKRQEHRRAENAIAKESGTALPKIPAKQTTVGHYTPMAFIIDCSFDALMNDNEIVSLSQQICRCYSGVRNALHRPQLLVSGYSGRLRHRFETVMHGQHKNWRGVQILEGGIAEVSEQAASWMKKVQVSPETPLPQHIIATGEESTTEAGAPSVIYLSSESPNVLSSLSPYTSYIIGGLVDKNRHKGHCYSVAQKANIATARLPIDEYVKLSARKVLTTNHVVEIMLKYLETGNWEESFLHVIPPRTGVGKKEDQSEDAKHEGE